MSLETYGRYQLIKKLATGGMAQIYLARQVGPEGFEKTLVLKRILPHLAENEDFITMFLDEARIAARLNHPNIVQIFDLGAQDDSYFIAMEYIHGEDARRVWKQSERANHPIPQALICRIIIESCAGLDYAHKKADASGRPLNIVHRDISPQNILVSFEGGVKVVDFGIAKAADQATVTRSGVLKGKYSYMSPEQASGQGVDHRTDIFALGVVLWELLTGERLFKRATDIQTLNAVTECKLAPPSSINKQIPPELDAIVMKALAKERTQRYQEAKHLAAGLEDWMLKNQLPSSSAQLAEFMHDIYAERLKVEAEEGRLLVETMEASRNDDGLAEPENKGERATPPSDADPRRTKSLRSATPASKGQPNLTSPERPAERPSRAGRVSASAPSSSASSLPKAANSSAGPAPRNDFRQTMDLPAANASANPPAPSQSPRPASSNRLSAVAPKSSNRLSAVAPAAPAPVPAPAQTLSEGEAVDPRPSSRQLPPAPETGSRTGLLIGVAGASLLVIGVLVALLVQNNNRTNDPEPVGGPEVRVTTVPAGATLSIDGSANCTTPCTPKLTPGSHTLEFSKSGFEPFRTALDVPKTGRVEPAPFVLVAKQEAAVIDAAVSVANVTIESQPSGAKVIISDAEAGTTPMVMHVPIDSPIVLRLELEGYLPIVDRFKATVSGNHLYALRPTPPAKDPRVVKQPVQPPPQKEPEVKQIGNGTVRFVVKPWATVDCPPYKFGDTPFPEQTMAAGDYRCRFKNDEGEQFRSVHVEAGKSQKVMVDFGQ